MIELGTLLSGAWTLLKEVSLGVGANELHRQLVERFQRAGAAELDLQKALYTSLCDAVGSLAKTLSAEDHPYFRSISDLNERRDEQQRVKEIFKTIRTQFPEASALKGPAVVMLEDTARAEVTALLGRLGIESYLAALPETLRNAFESNLPFAMLAHFRWKIATDARLHALFQLEQTTATTALHRELRAISDFLHQRYGNDDPAQIPFWAENLRDDLKSFIAVALQEVKAVLGEIKKEIKEQWEDDDLFRLVVAGSEDKAIKRYFEKKAADQIYRDAKLAENFVEKLERNGSLLIRGLPGSGKTMTGLALAEYFQQCRFRIFYVSLRHEISGDALVKGVRRRLNQPTLFLLDDCQGKFEMLEKAYDRLLQISTEMRGTGFLVFIARTTPTPEEMPRGDYSDFEESLEEVEAVLELQPTLAVFNEIITRVKPHFVGLSKERLRKIFEFTGHDLLLLDQLLATIDSPDQIDQLEPEKLFEKTLVRYFGAPTVHRPGFMKLAALAQFDLTPPVSAFPHDLEEEDEKAAAQLLVKADRPLRYFFLHSSAAELIFRALAWNSGRDDYPELAANHLIKFFKNSGENDQQLAVALSSVIRNRLKLVSDKNEENRLRSRFLTDDGIYAFIEQVFDQLPLNLMAVCLIILKKTDTATFGRYHDLVQRKIDDGTVLNMAIACGFSESGQFLQMVKREYPLSFPNLQSDLAGRRLRFLIKTMQFQNILSFLKKIVAPNNTQLVAPLDMVADNEFDEMIQRTIASGRSIGTINLALRELKKTNPALLEKLEHKIGAQRYLHLIASAGTIVELFNVTKHSSSSMAGELIDALDAEILDALIAKIIASGRSIGAIDLALRELKKTNPALLEKLEHKIGAQRYLHLIASAGTIVELFNVTKHSSSSMAGELIDALDAEILDALIAKTIASGRSIGTINFTLFELKKSNLPLLEKLERKIGAQRYLHLIASAGTIVELFSVTKHSSSSMAGELIDALDAEILDALIAKTIASGRSIGTIDLALRELKETNPALLENLEHKIGAQRYLHLIASAGTIFELFKTIEHASTSMAGELIDTLDAEILDALIAKTITSTRSIGNIHWALRDLKETNPALLEKLERKIGAKRWWQLICANGSISDLRHILDYMDKSSKRELIQASQDLSLVQWQELLLRRGFAELAQFVRWHSPHFSKQFTGAFLGSLKPTLETLIQRNDWEALNRGAAFLAASPDSTIKNYLSQLLHTHLITVDLGLLHFDAFDEAMHCVRLLSNELPTRRKELTDSLLTILPEEKSWRTDEEFLRAARHLFFILANPQARPEDARRVLATGNGKEVAALCAEATTLDLFLYLWNLYSLWFEWGEADETFATFLHAEIHDTVHGVLTKRRQTPEDQKEPDNLLALAGFLSFVELEIDGTIKAEWLSKLPSFAELHKRVSTKTFIPAVFFLLGLEWIFDRKDRVSRQAWNNLLPKAEKYDEETAALEHLRNFVRTRAGLKK